MSFIVQVVIDKMKKVKEKRISGKVKKDEVEFIENVKDFTGLIFHCPECDAEMHLHIAEIFFTPKKIIRK